MTETKYTEQQIEACCLGAESIKQCPDNAELKYAARIIRQLQEEVKELNLDIDTYKEQIDEE